MTVGELIEMLSQYDPDTYVMVGKYQRYGSDFAYDINDIEDKKKFSAFYGNDDDNVIFILEGEQAGTMNDKDDDDDDF